MNLDKIGRFIAQRRKEANLTQAQLAEKLNITDRAVSKWETGKSMPDSSVMLPLCEILKISANDLLSGEIVNESSYNEQMEKNLLDMVTQKQDADKRLLFSEIIMTSLALLFLFTMVFVSALVPMKEWLRITFILGGVAVTLLTCIMALKIEQVAGYYECAKCGHKYVPSFKNVLMAPHMGRTRKMKCPRCGKKSWHKKVINKD